jgi:hypothetical protein
MQERVLRQAKPVVETPQRDARAKQRERYAMLRLVQAKLAVGPAGDQYEREADEVADRVTAVIQRMSAPSPVPAAQALSHRCGPGCLHRHAGHDHDEHPEIGAEGGELGADLTARLSQAAGGGEPLGPTVRRSMEAAFGADFSAVRVHTDSDIAPRIGATAFTHGRDIHFGPGQYRPNDRAGAWLLSHELTHVVQQRPGRHVAPAAPTIRRHASKEHFILGAMTPKQISSMAKADKQASDLKGTGVKSKIGRIINGTTPPASAEVVEALAAIREQIAALEHWQAVTSADDATAMAAAVANKGKTLYNHTWGGQLLTVNCLDGEVPCTIGDMNALPDFFGSYDDLANVSKAIVFRTFQVIRRETYIYLKELEAKLLGGSYSFDRKADAFGGIEDNAVSLQSGALPGFGNAAMDVIQTTSMLKGEGGGEVGTDEAIAADATLGRNACHFPPESWLRWRSYHMRARALIASAANLPDLQLKANQAIGINAFGEHYLQDSYAAGHLINKGFVMAVAMEHVSAATKKARGMKGTHIRELQKATAHTEAYAVPGAAKARQATRDAGQAPVPGALENRKATTARDPQTALDAAKKKGAEVNAQGPHMQLAAQSAAKREEMDASGLAPGSMSFEQYRWWLNDFWLQKITNTLHDIYCLKGLKVSSPDQNNLFRVYGDSSMIKSAAGAEYTARTSQMSRDAINALVGNKRKVLTPAQVGVPAIPPKPVFTVEQILSRFPDTVEDDDGTVMSLENWATGQPMRDKIEKLVAVFTKERWSEGKLTGVIKGLSIAKDVAPGLSPAHGPF